MSSTLVTVMGFIVTITFIFLVLREKVSVHFAFVVLPVTAALILGHGFSDLKGWVLAGLRGNAGSVGMIVFCVIFFATMNRVGAFDEIVNFIVRKFNRSVMMVALAGWLVATVSTFDGAAPSTILVTVTAMLPIYKKMKMRPIFLGFQIAAVVSSMGLFPWSGNNLAIAAALSTDASEVFGKYGLIPAMIAGYIVGFIMMLFLAKVEERRIAAGKNDYLAESNVMGQTQNVEITERQRKARPLNILLMIALVVCFFTGWVQPALISMICCSLAFILNYPNAKEQQKAFRAAAPVALSTAAIFLTAGPYTQIMNKTGMMSGMVNAILSVLPTSWGGIMHIIIGYIAFPLSYIVGAQPFFYGVTPVVSGVAATAGGITALQAHSAFMAGVGPELLCCPTAPAMYLMLDMLDDMKLKDHTKYSFIWLWIIGIVMVTTVLSLGYLL